MKNSTVKKIEIDPANPVALADWGIIRDKYTTVLQMKARLADTKTFVPKLAVARAKVPRSLPNVS